MPDGLKDRHVVLRILCLDGIRLVIGSECLFGVDILMLHLLSMPDLGLGVLVHGNRHDVYPNNECGMRVG